MPQLVVTAALLSAPFAQHLPAVKVPNAATQLTVQIHDGRAAGGALYSGAALQALHTPRWRRPKLACPHVPAEAAAAAAAAAP